MIYDVFDEMSGAEVAPVVSDVWLRALYSRQNGRCSDCSDSYRTKDLIAHSLVPVREGDRLELSNLRCDATSVTGKPTITDLR